MSLRLWFTAFLVVSTFLSARAAEPLREPAPLPDVLGEEAFEAAKQFFAYDPSIALEPRVVEKTESEEATRFKVVLRGVRGFLVPGYLELPKSAARPLPCVLLLHGWSGSKSNWWQDGGYVSGGEVRKALLKQGCAVFALDAPAHGERMAENGYALPNDYHEEGLPSRRNYFSVDEIFVQGVVEYRRALDYLETRPEIDRARIGVLGYSMGGVQTFLLTAVEPRIKAAVACAPPSYAQKQSPISPRHYARGIGQRPFLIVMGRTDSMCPEAHAQQLIDLVPAKEKDLVFFDAGHKLPVEYVPRAAAWFEKRL